MKPDDQTQALDFHGAEIAIIGMAARFPGADSVDEFWQNLLLQREGIRHFSAEELAEAGISAAQLDDPAYVRAKGVLRDTMAFDAAFFSYSDREAALMDPQLRLYHECAWHALEDAGYAGRQSEAGRQSDLLTGIFGGASANALWTAQYARIAEQGGAAAYEVINLINRDFFNSRLAYKLNLKGPAVTVQTACSTSLVAVHQACQSLLAGDTDVALAGAVSLSLNPALAAPELQGYMYQEGMILSPDGHCRPFDADAQGTVLSDGVGFVVLKRLQDAIADGDRIHAVIKGSAINNDGNDKIGYTAPSASGQREALTAALTLAGVAPESVGYIEAHGTGTGLGDPIEVQALMQAYDGFPAPCLIGSVKGNLGHLDTAAGMAGLIKAVLAVRHGQVPASLHFQQLNPKCDLQGTGLQVAASNQPWLQPGLRRAGVSSFGIGGTNAHVIIEEYQGEQATVEIRNAWLLPLSAKTSASLNAYREQLQAWLPSAKSLGDVAFSLAHKRADFAWRQAILVDARGAFLSASQTTAIPETAPNLYWMFTGQGAQYPQMGRDLYASEPVFRAALDKCLAITDSLGVTHLRNLLLGEDTSPAAQDQLRATELAQPALFAVEYSLAQLLTSWGLKPAGFIGHSLGEYVAACLAGVFSLDDALHLVVARGRLMASTAPGAMLAVLQSADSLDLSQWPQLSLAAINGAQSCVLAGPPEAIAQAKTALEASGTATRPLNTSHAFHSPLMEPILAEFAAVLAQIPLRAPSLPIVSNLTGSWVEPAVMATPDYWVNQLRQPVHFHQGLACLLADSQALLLEVGPGKTLTSLARQHPARQPQQLVVHNLRAITETESDSLQPRRALGELWAAGVQIDWDACNGGSGNLCSLPGYAFERNTHMPLVSRSSLVDALPVGGFYREHWVSMEASELLAASSSDVAEIAGPILVLHNGQPDERALIEALTARGQTIIEVLPGDSFARPGFNSYQLRPSQAEDYHQLGQELLRIGQAPAKVVVLWQPDGSNQFNGELPSSGANNGALSTLSLGNGASSSPSLDSRESSSSRSGDPVLSGYGITENSEARATARTGSPLREDDDSHFHAASLLRHAGSSQDDDSHSHETSLRHQAGFPVSLGRLAEDDGVAGLRDYDAGGFDDDQGVGASRGNQYQAFAGLLLLTQALAQLGFTQPMGIYAITKGAFRVTGDEVLNPAATLVYGPIRSLGQELPQLHCHLLDITQLAAQVEPIASAISSAELPLVTAWRGQKIWQRQFSCEGDNWAKQVREGFKAGGVYVISGGFGGLGAELARHLAGEYQAKLLLASRRDQRQHPLLAELRNLGGEAVAIQADMREAGALAYLLSHAKNHFGQVTGLLHTAGLPGETLVLRHQLEKAVDVIATKLNPALDSLTLAPAYGLEQVVFFSSVTGILGGLGQTDYCAANSALDAVAEQARSLGLNQFYSIRWDAWRETGMAVDSLNARLPVIAASGHSLLGDQLAAADGSYIYSQTLTPEHCWALSEHWVMGQPTLPGTSYLEMAGAAFTRLTGQTAKTFSDIYFLSPLVLAKGESADVYTRLVPEANGYSFEVGSFHRQHKQWQLHARGQLQTAPASPLSLNNRESLSPLNLNNRGSSSSHSFDSRESSSSRSGDPGAGHPALKDLTLGTATADLAALKARNNQRYMDDIRGAADLGVRAMGLSLSQAEQDALMKYGPRWTVVRELWLGQNQGLARLELAEALRGDLSGMDLHPALLDCALSWLRAFLDGGVYIPLSYQRMVQYQPLPAEFYSQVTLSSALDKALGAMSFDLQLLSPAGEQLAEVTGFTMRRIDADFAAGAATRALPAPAYVHQYRELPKGLDTAAALAALEKIIVAAPPVALVAASDFIAREAGADQGDMGLFGAAAFTPPPQRARPAISVEYLAPKNPQQRQLAEVWQSLLGLEQVGIQDDFFELGGDSLLLMQVHKQLQGLFGSELAVVELYNHPTIEKLSAWLDSRKGVDGEAAADTTLDEVSDRIAKQKAARRRRERQD